MIQVQAGSYAESVRVDGKAVTLRGGFAAGFGSRDPVANVTTIDGQGNGTVVALVDAGDSVVDGFRITGGRATVADSGRGSGLRVIDSGEVTISHNLIEGNDDGNAADDGPAAEGGGLYASSYLPESSLTLHGNVIRDNLSKKGAAAAVFLPAVIEGNLIEGNRGRGDHGGALYLSASAMTLRGNLIRNNAIGTTTGEPGFQTYGWGGGGIFFGSYSETGGRVLTAEHNRWIGNSAPSSGSGFFVDDGAEATFFGDLFHDNVCPGGGAAALLVDGGLDNGTSGSLVDLENVTIAAHACDAGVERAAVAVERGSSVAIVNSIVSGNGGASALDSWTDPAPIRPNTVGHSLLDGTAPGFTLGSGILTGDPGFADLASRDLHLAATSQAIDAADPASPVLDEPVPHGGRRNLGAYGGTAEATPSTDPGPGPDPGDEPTPRLPLPGGDVWDATCATEATGTTYEVGPGRAYASIGAVPWASLEAGDRVRIHARPAPYAEKILLSQQGTATAPISVCGVRDDDGNRPVITGENATTRSGMTPRFPGLELRGLVSLGTKGTDPYGTKARYIVIEGLELRGARPGNQFTDSTGGTREFATNAAAIYVNLGEHITIRDNLIADNANGVFGASGAGDDEMSRHLLLDGNEFRDNSLAGRDREHHSYIEAEDVVYQFNHYADTRAGSLGGALKDRSSGVVVRYNWVEGGARAIDLVEAQEHWAIAQSLPSYRESWVYGNVIDLGNGDSSSVIHYGGDSGGEETYRKGDLYFFHNTVRYRMDRAATYHATMFDLSTDDETAHIWNNAFSSTSATAGEPATELYLARGAGRYLLGANAFSPSIADLRPEAFTGEITGWDDRIVPAGNDFGLTDDDLRPAAGSALVDAGGAAPVVVPERHALRYQYVPHRRALGRLVNGSAPDLGAVESGPGGPVVAPPDPSPSPTPSPTPTTSQPPHPTTPSAACTAAMADVATLQQQVAQLQKKIKRLKKGAPAKRAKAKRLKKSKLKPAKRRLKAAQSRVAGTC